MGDLNCGTHSDELKMLSPHCTGATARVLAIYVPELATTPCDRPYPDII